DAQSAEIAKTRERDAVFTGLFGGGGGGGGGGSSVLAAAGTILQVASNRPKKDMDREPEFQERNWSRTRESLERMSRTLDRAADRALLRYQLLEAAHLAPGERL